MILLLLQTILQLGALLPYVKSSGTEHGLLEKKDITQILAEVEELNERKIKKSTPLSLFMIFFESCLNYSYHCRMKDF